MRTKLSDLITEAAVSDPRVIVLSGDHGYALFDAIRKARPDQFVNVGVAEQAMVGIAAGLAKNGFLPIVYGLSAFVPIRVLEQIKLDLCISKLPVILLGDGAGLVYSTLGSSHQCAEDVSALRPMPHIRIYSPADKHELEVAFRETRESFAKPGAGPAYLRIGKSDRPEVHSKTPSNAEYTFLTQKGARTLLVGTGSMASSAAELSKRLGTDAVSVNRIKPFPAKLLPELSRYETVYVIEEHHRSGGLFSTITEELCEAPSSLKRPRIVSISLKDQFAERCGSHEYALSEHGMTNEQIEARIRKELS